MSHKLYWKIFAVVLVCLLVLSTGVASALRLPPSTEITFVSVPSSARASLERLSLSPIRTFDYGSFVWLELSGTDARRLADSSVPFTAEPDAGLINVRGFSFDPIASGAPAVPAGYTSSSVDAARPGLHLVKLAGPTQSAWLDTLEASGLHVLQYYPNYTYLVWGAPTAIEATSLQNFVLWSAPFQPAYKPGPGVTEATGDISNLAITFYNSGNVATVLNEITAMGGKYIQHFPAQPDEAFFTAIYSFNASGLTALAGIPEVWSIEFSSNTPGFDDEVSSQIVAGNYSGSPAKTSPGYFAWLASLGLDGTGVTWADVDTGLVGTHPDIAGRTVTYVTYAGAPAANTDSDGHGSHTAGTIFGDPRAANGGSGLTDGAGFYWGLGIAPRAGMVIQNALMGAAWPPAGGWQQLSKDSVINGAVGSSNSWYTGAVGAQGYSATARTHDLMVRDGNFDTAAVAEPLIMVFSAGNAGPTASSITEPHEAKNLIVVGASDNYTRTGASINGLGSFSSRGPALDGRILPNVTAPGVNTTSWRGTGAASCSATGVGGAANTLYSYCTGTSMAAPQVSGSAALIVQWWKNANAGLIPSPAMIKALLINNAVDMAGGTNVGGSIPNNNQGWGRVNLGNVFGTDVSKVYHDQDQTLVNTGEEVLYNITVFDTAKPVKISLVWSDAPGAIGAAPNLVNNLDLRVVNGADTYLGNVMTSGWSATGGTADTLNNIENVYIQTPGASIQVYVTAANIAGDGVPYNGDATDQDFALVCTNCTTSPDYNLSLTPATQQICQGSDATFTAVTTSLNGYTDPITLSASGEPAGTSKNFSANPVLPGSSSNLTIGSTAGADSGDYSIQVSGSSTSGAHSDSSNLTIVSLNDVTTLSSPGNGLKTAPLQPAFTWSAVIGATSYDIQIATDSNFANIVDSAAGLVTNSYTPAASLTSNTLYYWRVRVNNTCGAANFSSSSHFLTINTNASTASYCSAPAANIPDNNPSGVFSQVNIPDSGIILDMDVAITATHAYVGDLGFTVSDVLINPSTPVSVTVIDRPGVPASTYGCNGSNIDVILSDQAATPVETTCLPTAPTLNGTLKPNNLLSSFNGKSVTGNWRIKAFDAAAPDAGVLQKWCLNVTLASITTYAHPTDATCGGNSPCFSGADSLQKAVNAVADGGTVHALGAHTTSSPLTCVSDVTVTGASDMSSSVTWSGGAGSIFVAETGCSLTVKGLNISGAGSASAFTANGAGAVIAFANNISNTTGAYSGSAAPLIGHNYWGTSDPTAAAPTGMPAGEWSKRLGAPALGWSDGPGSAVLGSASLSGGTGTTAIVSMGGTAPFGNGVAGFADKMCSPYYDFFVVNGSGTWMASFPVTNNAACNSNTLSGKKLYSVSLLSNCTPSTNTSCWSPVNPALIVINGQNLELGGLTPADLDGTFFVAGSESGTDPTLLSVRNFSASSSRLSGMLFAGIMLGIAGAAAFLMNVFRRKPNR